MVVEYCFAPEKGVKRSCVSMDIESFASSLILKLVKSLQVISHCISSLHGNKTNHDEPLL